MDLCHLKNSELEPQFQTYKGRVVLRSDIVNDDSGSYAVFTEQGSSAFQRQPQKSRTFYQGFQDVQDKQQMQYPLLLRSKWKMHQRCLKFPNRNVQIFGSVYHDTSGPSHGAVSKTQSFLLNGSVWSSFARTVVGKAI